jgi:hypothetical protein
MRLGRRDRHRLINGGIDLESGRLRHRRARQRQALANQEQREEENGSHTASIRQPRWERWSRDRRKLEELSSRETRHPAVFAWQTQFAGAAHRILPRNRGEGAGIGGSSRSCLHAKHGILPFSLGKRSLLVLRMASCHAIVEREPGSAEARGAFGFFDLLWRALP